VNRIDLPAGLLQVWRGPAAGGVCPERTALLVIDMQIGFIEPGYPSYCAHTFDIIPNVNRLISACRDAGIRIVFTRHTVIDEMPYAPPAWQLSDPYFRPVLEGLRPSASGHAVHSRIDIQPTDRVINKHRYSAFLPLSCSLEAELRTAGIDTVIISGTVTDVCCESSARDAHMLGYDVIFVADATATSDDGAHNGALLPLAKYFANVKTTDQVIRKLESPDRIGVRDSGY
jgi:ureidoacrylate peracid hydrolase